MVVVDGRRGIAQVDGSLVLLTDIECSLLEALSDAGGETVSSYDLARAAYGSSGSVSSNALRQRMYRLSHKLGRGRIRNVYGYGYRLEQ